MTITGSNIVDNPILVKTDYYYNPGYTNPTNQHTAIEIICIREKWVGCRLSHKARGQSLIFHLATSPQWNFTLLLSEKLMNFNKKYKKIPKLIQLLVAKSGIPSFFYNLSFKNHKIECPFLTSFMKLYRLVRCLSTNGERASCYLA